MPNPKLDISIVIPTYNEVKNVPFLVEEIFKVLSSLPHVDAELIIVDDNSPDGTGPIAEELRDRYPVRVIHRAGKLGLGSAVMEGFKLSTRPYLGVMDGDLSHDPSVLPEMLTRLVDHDIVIGSRFDPASRMEGAWPLLRKTLSLVGVFFAKLITSVSDPLSGYFFASSHPETRYFVTDGRIRTSVRGAIPWSDRDEVNSEHPPTRRIGSFRMDTR